MKTGKRIYDLIAIIMALMSTAILWGAHKSQSIVVFGLHPGYGSSGLLSADFNPKPTVILLCAIGIMLGAYYSIDSKRISIGIPVSVVILIATIFGIDA